MFIKNATKTPRLQDSQRVNSFTYRLCEPLWLRAFVAKKGLIKADQTLMIFQFPSHQ